MIDDYRKRKYWIFEDKNRRSKGFLGENVHGEFVRKNTYKTTDQHKVCQDKREQVLGTINLCEDKMLKCHKGFDAGIN